MDILDMGVMGWENCDIGKDENVCGYLEKKRKKWKNRSDKEGAVFVCFLT